MQLLHYPDEVLSKTSSSGNYHLSVQMKHAVLSSQFIPVGEYFVFDGAQTIFSSVPR